MQIEFNYWEENESIDIMRSCFTHIQACFNVNHKDEFWLTKTRSHMMKKDSNKEQQDNYVYREFYKRENMNNSIATYLNSRYEMQKHKHTT